MKQRHLNIVQSLLSQPTAPFHEEKIVEQVRRWADKRGADFSRDKAGNVFVHHRGRGRRKGPRWVFAAHMDHPGFVVSRVNRQTVWADFFGGVAKKYFPGSRVRLFGPDGEVLATVAGVRASKNSPGLACRLKLDRPCKLPAGTVGMWDLPAMRIRGKRLITRACDDVVGSAAVICALDEIISRKIEADVTAMLTRAEEAAFVGALAACRDDSIGSDAMIISVETSKAQPGARLGDGAIIRVGDAARTFDPMLTAHISAVAEALSKRDRNFRFARQLMPGGTCESTVYAMWDYMTAALCLPLANLHNQGPGNRIAAEQIHTDDFAGLVKLIVAITAETRSPRETDKAFRKKLDQLLKTRRKYL